jgi:dTDP-4-amino-4,6-dideoxygalactose transaminase
MGFKSGYCPEAEQYYAEAISMPMYPSLTEMQQNRVASVLKKVIEL